MRTLFLDCFSGISGDMTVGALCDLGVTPSTFEWELAKLDLGDFHTHFERQSRNGIEGVKFSIHEGATHSHEHESAHEHVHGRRHDEIRTLIEASELSDTVKRRALSLFNRIAVAEGRIHGVPPEKVAFHEVGALDSIADIVCTCVGIEQLGVERVVVSPLAEGRGWVECAHGRFPIPVPAVLEILSGITLGQTEGTQETITPTGAAIVAEFAEAIGPMPPLRIAKVGYGVGTRVSKERPNVLRAILGDSETKAGFETDTVMRIETNLDDLSPEILGATLGKLIEAGALDAFLTPIQMKKNRPGTMLTVLCELEKSDSLAEMILAETTSFGIRMDEVRRLKLERRFEVVGTEFGDITIKLGFREGKIVQATPEFESCRDASEKTGASLRAVYDAAKAAARSLSS